MFRVFHRRWWKDNPAWPNGLEPDPTAKKTTIALVLTESEARRLCREYLERNPPGRYSDKAEYERIEE